MIIRLRPFSRLLSVICRATVLLMESIKKCGAVVVNSLLT